MADVLQGEARISGGLNAPCVGSRIGMCYLFEIPD